ncbi:hypothetical protein N0V90_011458 [Kalmusia sp. IMI 367209]|nr:hypothetical protein N0V90_011458 [Kalmusia sp. IMI 367209]
MTDLQPHSYVGARDMVRAKSHRLSLLRNLRPHKSSTEAINVQPSPTPRPCPTSTLKPPSRPPSISGFQDALPDSEILKAFSRLHQAIIGHVRKFYTPKGPEKCLSQAVIEHASAGIALPWPQILGLLGDTDTRLATLTLCIAWTILSRSLLVKLGTSSSPGSTFLPPEIVECFQSFSLGKGAITLGKDNTNPVNFALLSRWKQISASLLHSTYVANAFSLFDSRTVNVERALKDLDPLLATYAMPHDGGHGKNARLEDLRDVLREGALFAFTLFGQPCFWKFDWQSDRAVAHGKTAAEFDPERASTIGSVGVAATTSVLLTRTEIVVWPNLLRVMDGEGVRLHKHDEGAVIGEKKYLNA